MDGLQDPTALDPLPDGRILIADKGGNISVFENGSLRLVHRLPDVNTSGFRGLLSLAADPDFPVRPYLYTYHSADGAARIEVSRFLVDRTGPPLEIDPASRTLWIDGEDLIDGHDAGALRFDGSKNLLVSMGDDTDGCAAQDLTRRQGKVLRLRVGPGADPADLATLAPADNPFYGDPDLGTRLVYAYGLRNPFRFDVDPVRNELFVGDPGEDSREEISVVRGGENLGWPYFEGNLTHQTVPCPFHAVIPPTTDPVHQYQNPTGQPAAVISPLVYHGRNYPADSSFPPRYEGAALFLDFYSGSLRALRWNGSSSTYELLPGLNQTDLGAGYSWVTDMRTGPDGAVYYLQGGGLRRIAYDDPAVPARLSALSIATLILAGLACVVMRKCEEPVGG
jgi:glucose/arabinose dehydrogenase